MVWSTFQKAGLPLVVITLTVSDTWFETQSSAPPGRTATETGSRPTGISTSTPVAVSITLTVLLVVLAT